MSEGARAHLDESLHVASNGQQLLQQWRHNSKLNRLHCCYQRQLLGGAAIVRQLACNVNETANETVEATAQRLRSNCVLIVC